jgi:hypothetical protein
MDFFFEVKKEVEEMESRVKEKRGMTSSVKFDEEIFSWVPNIGFSSSKDTK